MTPTRLTVRGRELFVLQQAAGPDSRGHTVLLCNPFGQEAIRAHRFYRVLGDRLCAAGFDVVRFDYFGSGDSSGDDEAFDLQGAVDDTVAIADWARSHHAAARLSLLGLRLGGSVAMLASEKLALRPSRLLLFEPVLDGARYIEQLLELNARTLSQLFGSRWRLDADLRARNLPRAGEDECLGFVLGAALKRQLREFLPVAGPWTYPCEHALVLSRDTGLLAHWQPCAKAPRLSVRDADSDIDWATNSAANTAIVPMRWIEQALECLREEPTHA